MSRTGYGPEGGLQEPVLAKSAISSFLKLLRAVGIAILNGVSLVDSLARESSEAAPSTAS